MTKRLLAMVKPLALGTLAIAFLALSAGEARADAGGRPPRLRAAGKSKPARPRRALVLKILLDIFSGSR